MLHGNDKNSFRGHLIHHRCTLEIYHNSIVESYGLGNFNSDSSWKSTYDESMFIAGS